MMSAASLVLTFCLRRFSITRGEGVILFSVNHFLVFLLKFQKQAVVDEMGR